MALLFANLSTAAISAHEALTHQDKFGSSPCRTFTCTDYTQGKVFVFEEGEIVWEHDAPLSNDLWVLENGNLLFTTGNGVLEVTPAQDTVFCYTSQSRIFACQRLKNGNTFIGECTAGRLLEVSPEGKTIKQLTILSENDPSRGDGYIRNARRLDNGHYLVAHYAGKRVVEYNKKGRIVWQAPIEGGAHSVVRLANGHTVVAATDKARNPKIIEFDKKGNIVWELSNKDLEGEPLKFMSGFQYLPESDSFVVTNWQGHGIKEKGPHILWVSRDKKVLDTFTAHSRIETVSSIFINTGSKKAYH